MFTAFCIFDPKWEFKINSSKGEYVIYYDAVYKLTGSYE